MLASLEEVEVFTTDEVVVTVVTRLVRMCFARSTSVWVRVLYVAGFGKSFGQSAARWSWKKLRHFMQPSFLFKSLPSESSSFRHCLRGAESHTSKFSNTFCCKCHKGEVYITQQSFTWASSKYWE